MEGKLIIFTAPSGAGKTTIVKHIMNLPHLKLEFSVSACSRQPRKGETNGKDYYFLTQEEFRNKISQNDFIEWEEVYEGMFYGTLKSEVERIWSNGNNAMFDVDVKGALNIKKHYGEKALSIFVKPPSIEVLRQRLIDRSTETEASLKKRIERAEYELTFADKCDKIIINDKLEDSLKEAETIIQDFLT